MTKSTTTVADMFRRAEITGEESEVHVELRFDIDEREQEETIRLLTGHAHDAVLGRVDKRDSQIAA